MAQPKRTPSGDQGVHRRLFIYGLPIVFESPFLIKISNYPYNGYLDRFKLKVSLVD